MFFREALELIKAKQISNQAFWKLHSYLLFGRRMKALQRFLVSNFRRGLRVVNWQHYRVDYPLLV